MKRPTRMLTEAEAIAALRVLARRWPPSLWLFAASGSLFAMRTTADGGRAHVSGGGYDPDFVVGGKISIPCDGGDW